jgi:diketogulonate reductase-like aldo/keto reductase
MSKLTRRELMRLLLAGTAGAALAPSLALAVDEAMKQKLIPASGERIPVIGMGTWRTFNVGDDEQLRMDRTRVLEAFFEHGGGMVDCSPMYGSAAAVMGFALEKLGYPDGLFSAEKVWTEDEDKTREQVAEQERLWGIEPFDLMQVHNLVAWEAHLEKLQQMKADGEIRYVGITTSSGRRHDEFERIMENHELDFVQLTYNITHRRVEERLLPLAEEKGIAVIANRPYDAGPLIRDLKSRHSVPDWAVEEFDCRGWADFLLKFLVSHPAVTCAIPATTSVEHLHENMRAGTGPMPTPELRQRMIDHIESL